MGTFIENLVEKVQKGGRAIYSRLGEDVPDDKNYNDYSVSREDRNILENARKECEGMAANTEWPLTKTRRKAAKPTTGENIVNINRERQRATGDRDISER